MRVSAIIPTLEEDGEIAAAVASARAAGADEVVVADGGSKDATVASAQLAGADAVLWAPRSRGAQARAGAASATGAALWFLHADARAPMGAAEAIRSALDGGEAWGAFRVRHAAEGWAARLADRRSRHAFLPYGDQGVFCTRQAYDAAGGMPAQPLMEDLEFALRMLRAHGPPARLALEIRVSARRLRARPVRTALCWWTFPVLYRFRVSPTSLARWYGVGR